MNYLALLLLLPGVSSHDADAQAALALAKASMQVQTARAPEVKPAPKPQSITPAGLHSHRCSACGTVWSHGHESYGKVSGHTCPGCGRVNWQPIPYQQPVTNQIKRRIDQYPPSCPPGVR